jgi:hypothetical protein
MNRPGIGQEAALSVTRVSQPLDRVGLHVKR